MEQELSLNCTQYNILGLNLFSPSIIDTKVAIW